MADYIELDSLRQRFFDVVSKAESDCLHIDSIVDIIKNEPTADVRENVHGEWLPVLDRYGKQDGDELYAPLSKCSKCGVSVIAGEYANFCPNCGADMRGADNE